jgi:hypothetical protein
MSNNTVDIIALLLGTVGAATGVLGYLNARNANRTADKSNKIATDANSISKDALGESREANRIASESRDIARRVADYQIESGEAAKRAKLIPEVGGITHSHESVQITLKVRNEGPSVARNLKVRVLRNDEDWHTETAKVLPVTEPHAGGARFKFPARVAPFRSAIPDDEYCAIVTYDDDESPQKLAKACFRFIGKRSEDRPGEWQVHRDPPE